MNLGTEALKGSLGKFVQGILGFGGVIVFTRLVGKSDFGGYYLLLSLVLLANRPIVGVANAVMKRWSEVDGEHRQLFGAVLVINTILSIVVLGGVYLLRDPLVDYVGLDGAPLLFVTLFVCLSFFAPTQRMLAGNGWPAKKIWNDTLRSVFTLVLQIVLVLSGLGALGMGYGTVGATILVVPVALYYLRVVPALPSRETLESIWEYARYSTPTSLINQTYNKLDVILLGFFVGTVSVANYEVALKLTIPAGFVSAAIGSGLMPKISNATSRGEGFIDDVKNSVGYTSILAIPIFFGALAIPEALVVTAFSGEYTSAAPYLVGLALYQLLSTQSGMYNQTLRGMDHPDLVFRLSAVTLTLNILLGVGLVLWMGPLGIVIATVCAEALQYILSFYYVQREATRFNPIPRPVQMQLVAGGVMFIAVELLSRIGIGSWMELLFVVGSGGLVYGVVLLGISSGLRLTAKSIYRDAVTGE